MNQSPSVILVTVAYPNQPRKCKQLITALLKKWLAQCIQRHNYIKSYSMQEWTLKNTEEKLLVIKATSDKQDALISLIKKLHPYEAPEIIVQQPAHVDPDYLAWLQKEV